MAPPGVAKASEALDILGQAFSMVQGDKLFLAPIDKSVKKVLDIGCGTGTWAIDFADEFPDTEVIGTDISPIQPAFLPANVRFEIDDCTKPWTFASNTFDYVHIRYMIGSIASWDGLFSEAYKALKPGGYLESFETGVGWPTDDGTDTEATRQWGRFFHDGIPKLGNPASVVTDGLQEKAMKAAGFVDIEKRPFKCPVGAWPRDKKLKELGQFTLAAVVNDMDGWIMYIADKMGWSFEEIQVYCARLRQQLKSGKHHVYFDVQVVWGRKPGE